jgi:hypothetical protein
MNVDTLLDRAQVWRGGELPPTAGPSVSTGFPDLNALLPGGGWPQGSLTEILSPTEGLAGLRLMLPALARLGHSRRWLAWVAPPCVPYAPALAAAGIDLSRVLLVHPRAENDALWAVEQALRSGTCSAVLAWIAGAEMRILRRLQLAAEAGHSWGILFRPDWAGRQPSPAAVRLQLAPTHHGCDVQILKRRGGWSSGPLHLDFDHALARPASAAFAPGGLHPRLRRQ